MHPRTLTFLALAGALLAGCSKKEESPPPTDAVDATTASEGQSSTPPVSDEEGGDVRFTLPGAGANAAEREKLATAEQELADAEAAANFTPARLYAYYPPFYPLPWRMEGVESIVEVAMRVNVSGGVDEVAIVSATAPEFEEFVLEAAKHWRFLPAERDGEPASAIIRTTIPFISEFGSDPSLLAGSPLARLAYLDGRYYRINDAGKYVPVTSEPVPIRRVEPVRGPDSNWGKNLRVTLVLTVNERGRVLEPAIHESSGDAGFDAAALEAVRFWQFIPRLRDGTPSSSRAQLPIIYTTTEPVE